MKLFKITNDKAFQAVVDYVSGLAVDPDTDREMASKTEATRSIIEGVRTRGDEAVAEFTERFDGVSLDPADFELTPDEIDKSISTVEPGLLAALARAHQNIKAFHEKNVRQSWEESDDDGTILGQRINSIESAGVYVPGGKAYYPSSVLMNIVPARVAGVKDIVMVSPPSYNGSIHPLVLAAAQVAGATRVFRVGGAQSIAALAHGTDTIPAVLKITGPGNIYVTLAKRSVSAICAIDTEAGPSEVVVIADGTSDARFAASELLAQAEHDEDACSILLTTSEDFAKDVQTSTEQEMSRLPREEIIRKSLENHGTIIVTRSMDEAIKLTDLIAPEHLALQVEYPRRIFDQISNAGAVMFGHMTPVAVGDYYAGPNHILPTGRQARFSSPLTADDFLKVTNFMSYTQERISRVGDDIRQLAEAEELTAHARAVELRQ